MDSPLPPTMVSRAPTGLALGTLFAERYEILDALGEGGMGAVYRVRDRELDENVALKVLRPELAGHADALLRFRREVKLARRVTHPNVARTFDLGSAGGMQYLTMELIVGESLARRTTRAQLSLGDALRISHEIATGLCAAHAASVIHRNLKPDNVMLSGERIVLTDFGIASLAEGREQGPLATGMIVGTPAYMAPEQIEGKPIDGRTDVYALGVLLYELLTGALPFPGATALAAAAAKLNGKVPDPRSQAPSTPPGLASLVMAAMEPRREARLDAAQLRDRLEELRGIGGRGRSASLLRETPARPSSSLTAPRMRRTVSVVPFDAPEHAALGRDLATAASDLLSRENGVELLSAPPSELRVEGSVRVAQSRVRVRLRLFDGEPSASPIWAEVVEGTLEDSFAIEDAVAGKLVAAVVAQLPSRATPGPADPAARDVYDRARSALTSLTPSAVDEAIGILEPAIARNPDAQLLALMSAALHSKWMVTGARVASFAARAEDAALRALDGRARPPLALLTLASLREQSGELAAAVRGYRETLELGPTLGTAHRYFGELEFVSGRAADGLRHLERAIQLDPENAHGYVAKAQAAGLVGEVEGAKAAIAEAHRRGASLLSMYAELRLAFWSRDLELAKPLVARMAVLPPEISFRAAVPLLQALIDGRPVPPQAIAGVLAGVAGPEVAPRRRVSVGTALIDVAAWSGHTELALVQLEALLPLPFIDLTWLDCSPNLERLRSEPRFARVRAQVAERVAELWR